MAPRGKQSMRGKPAVAPRKPQTRAAKTTADRMVADEEAAILRQEPSGYTFYLQHHLLSTPLTDYCGSARLQVLYLAQAAQPLTGAAAPAPPEARDARPAPPPPETPPPCPQVTETSLCHHAVSIFVADMPGAGALETEILQNIMEVFQRKTSMGTEYFILTIPTLRDLAETYSPLKDRQGHVMREHHKQGLQHVVRYGRGLKITAMDAQDPPPYMRAANTAHIPVERTDDGSFRGDITWESGHVKAPDRLFSPDINEAGRGRAWKPFVEEFGATGGPIPDVFVRAPQAAPVVPPGPPQGAGASSHPEGDTDDKAFVSYLRRMFAVQDVDEKGMTFDVNLKWYRVAQKLETTPTS
ncbi:hypothetical protein JB92DRAFT_3117363 [Gautieria morchelliformis]|nr:hypothetical protein JB92DRAFT_3117363 [Gautieria morchelliformis]